MAVAVPRAPRQRRLQQHAAQHQRHTAHQHSAVAAAKRHQGAGSQASPVKVTSFAWIPNRMHIMASRMSSQHGCVVGAHGLTWR